MNSKFCWNFFLITTWAEEEKIKIESWQEQVHSIIEMLRFINKDINPFHCKESVIEFTRLQRSKTELRSGDKGFLEFLESVAKMDIAVEKIQRFLLFNTKGTDLKPRMNLLINTQNIYNDLYEICGDLSPSLKLDHRNALELNWK